VSERVEHPRPVSVDAMLVRAAYEPVVRSQLEAAVAWNRRFPRTRESIEKARLAEQEEDQRIQSLMKAHQPEPGTTSVCRCGFSGYSTAGYLQHLYTVAVNDYVARYC
jgi:hypothetical protein